MSVISLLTDFGYDDEFIGTMKGVILTINPSAQIVDITHHIDPQDRIGAAYMLCSYYRYFPKKTVHVVVVDPGVGTDRAILAVRIKEYIMLAPDNGVLTLVMDDVDEIIRVDNAAYYLNSVSRTFHGRDIFAPVAAHISNGVAIRSMGLHHKNPIRLQIDKPFLSDDGGLDGHIVFVDHFGNLITNIDAGILKNISPEDQIEIRLGEICISGLSQTYQDMKIQTPIALIGSRGYLEIAVSCGNAAERLRAKKGDRVRVRRRYQGLEGSTCVC